MMEATQKLYYASAPAEDAEPKASSPGERAQKVLTWTILAVCLLVWAAVGALFWVPLLLRRIVTYSLSLVASMLGEREPRHAARRLRAAVRFYGRGFKVTAEMVTREPSRPSSHDAAEGERTGRVALLGNLMWTLMVWYAVLFVAGVVHATPLDLWAWLVALPWQERIADPVMEWVRTHRP